MSKVALHAAVFSVAIFSIAGSPAVSSAKSTDLKTPGAISVQTAAVPLGSQAATAKPAKPTRQPATKAKKLIKVRAGDYLSKIAKKHNSTVQALYDANKKIKDPDLIFPGEKLRVPDPSEKLKHRTLPSDSAAAVQAKAETTVYSTAVSHVDAPAVASGSVWDRLAQCEAGGNWSINTGNGFYGGLQFTQSSWRAVGGTGLASDASRSEQIMRAKKLKASQGWGAWPACSAKLGL